MKTIRVQHKTSIALGISLCLFLPAAIASAQGSGRRGGGPGGPGRAAQGARFSNAQSSATGQIAPVASRNANGGQRPFVEGTILQGNLNTGQILIQSQRDGVNRVVQVTANTQIVTQIATTIANLQVGDRIQVPGGPDNSNTSNTSRSSVQSNNPGQYASNMPPRQQRGPVGMANIRSDGQPTGSGPGAGFGRGRVTATNPLTITLDNGATLSPTVSSETQVMKILPITFSNLNIGDRVMVMGQTASDGSVIATDMAVNMPIGMGSGPRNSQTTTRNSTSQSSSGPRGMGGPDGHRGPSGPPPNG